MNQQKEEQKPHCSFDGEGGQPRSGVFVVYQSKDMSQRYHGGKIHQPKLIQNPLLEGCASWNLLNTPMSRP